MLVAPWHSCQSGFQNILFHFCRLIAAEGWRRLQTNRSSEAWVWSNSWDLPTNFGALCMPSFLICCSIATKPSFLQLGIFVFILLCICLALAPWACSRFWAARVAWTAIVQYFRVSIWNFHSLVKLISSKNLLPSGTSSGAKSANDSISFKIVVAVFLWR